MPSADDEIHSLILSAAQRLSISQAYVEKDLRVFLLLKELFRDEHLLVFKGGTSLSMCFNLIRRFSEDIDISYGMESVSRGERRKAKEKIIQCIAQSGCELMNPGQQRSRRILNKFFCSFPSNFSINGRNEVRIELAAQAPSFPVQEAFIQPLVIQGIPEPYKDEIISKYGWNKVKVRTQAPLRTFVDKVFALCDYYVLGKMTRYSRHIYDLKCLSNVVDLNQGFLDLFQRIRSIREELEYCPSSKPGLKVSALLKEIIQTHYYRDDYRRLTAPLLYDQTKYESCIEAIERIADYLFLNGF